MEKSKTDRQTDKTSRWAFTAYVEQWPLFEVMPELISQWGWQKEICPDTLREHYQGYILTKRQVRFAQLSKIFPKVHIEAARNWDALLNYCKKLESAVPGSQVIQSNASVSMTMADALMKLAAHVPFRQPVDWLNSQNPLKDLEEQIKQEFWAAVNSILRIDPNSVGLWTQPQYYRAWINTRQVWMEKFLDNLELAGEPCGLVVDDVPQLDLGVIHIESE